MRVSGNGGLTRLDRATGKQVWHIETGIVVSGGGVSSGAGLVLVGGDKGDVLAYGEDGKLRWKSLVSSEVLNVSPVVDGVVLVRTGDGRIAALSAADGKRIWLYERSTPALVVRSHAGVTIVRGVAYAGFAGGKLAAINIKDGAVLWESYVSQPSGNTELERISDITSDPVVDDKQVCAVAFQGRVACFDTEQGGPLWNREISSDKGLVVLSKYIYLTDMKGSIISLDKTSGSTVWKNDQLFMRGVTAPYASDKFVVVGDFEGYLHALNREDGSFVARIRARRGCDKGRADRDGWRTSCADARRRTVFAVDKINQKEFLSTKKRNARTKTNARIGQTGNGLLFFVCFVNFVDELFFQD